MLVRRLATFAFSFNVLIACAQPGAQPGAQAEAQPGTIAGTSKTKVIRGEYAPVKLPDVDRVSIEGGKLVLHAAAASVTVELPSGVDTGKPTRNWALTTDADAGDQTAYTFTHAESLDDFTIELPTADGELRYGVFERGSGGEVMALAWAGEGKSYFGWVAIGQTRVSPRRRSRGRRPRQRICAGCRQLCASS
jgi:hypothetical protein